MPRFALLPIAASFLFAAASAMAQSTTEAQCPAGTGAHVLGELTFCIPQSNERYLVTPNGIGPVYWLGEEPIAPPADIDSLKDADVTIARVWADRGVVGASDQESGKKGFDRFLDVIATHILKADKEANGAAEFKAAVPVDESGLLQPFRFQRLESGILKGVREEPDGSEAYVMLLRPSAGEKRPHLMLCGAVSAGRDSSHLCMSFISVLDQRLAITVAGKNLERTYRVSEDVGKDLASFVKQPAP